MPGYFRNRPMQPMQTRMIRLRIAARLGLLSPLVRLARYATEPARTGPGGPR
jgi:hypothetical protein